MPVCEHYQTTKGLGNSTSHSVPLEVQSLVGTDLLGPLKEIDGYKYIDTAVYYIQASLLSRAFKRKDCGGSI